MVTRRDGEMEFDKTTTIVVTGANGLVGRALLKRLQEVEAQKLALVRQPAELSVKRLVIGPLNSPEAMAAIKNADYVVHLAGVFFPIGKDSYQSSNVGTAEAIADALKNGKAKRILFLSHVGASEDAKNPYLRTKAVAERILAGTGKEVVVFRCTHIIGSPDFPGPFAISLLAKSGKKAGVLGNGRQIVAPVYVEDVVSALITAMKSGFPGVYELSGPEQMSMDDLVRLLNRNPAVPISHCPNWMARVLGAIVPVLPEPFVEMILKGSVGDPSRAKSTFGLKLTPLRTVWK